MPSFHAKMQSKLRTEAMGADTVVWLAVSAAAIKQPSGLFFQGQKLLSATSNAFHQELKLLKRKKHRLCSYEVSRRAVINSDVALEK